MCTTDLGRTDHESSRVQSATGGDEDGTSLQKSEQERTGRSEHEPNLAWSGASRTDVTESRRTEHTKKRMKGLVVAVALYFALSFATYDGTITPPKDSPAIRRGDYADKLIYGSASRDPRYYGMSGAYGGDY